MSFRFTRSKKETSLVLGLLLSLAPVPFIAGCKDEDKNTKQPVLPTVQVNPIVVLKPGEQIGGPSNGGSRLSKAQMTDHLNSLNGFARKHWKFQISYPMQGGLVDPLVFEDQQLIAADLPFNGRDARKFEIAEWLFNSLPTANNSSLWNPNKVNVFFTGNVQVNPANPAVTRANTVDPGDAVGPVVRHIYINDFGFYMDPPKTELGWHVLPHEFCHYLIRQKNGRYNSTEHAPSTAMQLMRPITPHPAIVIAADQQEVMQRVRGGSVNAP